MSHIHTHTCLITHTYDPQFVTCMHTDTLQSMFHMRLLCLQVLLLTCYIHIQYMVGEIKCRMFVFRLG
jgi:hypothetical protein